MSEIKVRKPSEEELNSLGIKQWQRWECQPSSFDWAYVDTETCYIQEGKAKVSTADGEVAFGKGDLVEFPKGLKCKWEVIEKIKKVYKFG